MKATEKTQDLKFHKDKDVNRAVAILYEAASMITESISTGSKSTSREFHEIAMKYLEKA